MREGRVTGNIQHVTARMKSNTVLSVEVNTNPATLRPEAPHFSGHDTVEDNRSVRNKYYLLSPMPLIFLHLINLYGLLCGRTFVLEVYIDTTGFI
jgi:hypothetical protein